MNAYFICTCDHPDTFYDPACRCCTKRPTVRPPVDTEAVQVLRQLVAMNDALIARTPVRNVTETWAWARSVLQRAGSESK